jgi:hypothetical protein
MVGPEWTRSIDLFRVNLPPYGQSGLERFERDVLAQADVKYVTLGLGTLMT